MIPFIRSISELMAITEPRKLASNETKDYDLKSSTVDSGQRKRYIKSIIEKEVGLPDLPKTKRCKWISSKDAVSKFLSGFDYNNQIQSSYDLTLLARQIKTNHQDAA